MTLSQCEAEMVAPRDLEAREGATVFAVSTARCQPHMILLAVPPFYSFRKAMVLSIQDPQGPPQ